MSTCHGDVYVFADILCLCRPLMLSKLQQPPLSLRVKLMTTFPCYNLLTVLRQKKTP